ncbi:TonB-dependent receptor, partial [Thioalkalivibrio sp.]|uniref:TonB-dependent receptor plug domain-containing protein n=1 Tax=Thioalkalivibrio sp. TaxID=2093813 RepID=UPI0012D6F506
MRTPTTAALGLAAAVAAVFAQADDATVLAPVTVTAKGYEALIADTPRSVNVIEADTIQRTQARTLGDLLRGQPGLAVAVDGSVGLDPIIRGLKRDQVLVLVDGVRINALQPPGRGSLASYVNVDMIERIEVIRGPSSVLYGSGAMGGVINIITRGGDFTEEPELNGWSRLGYTSVDDGVRAAVGVSASDPRNVLDLAIAHLDTNDYRMGDGDRLDDSATEQTALSLRYRRQLTEGHEIQFQAQRDRRKDVWYLASRNFREDPLEGGFPQPGGLNTHYAPEKTRDLLELSYTGEFGGSWAPRLSASIYRQQMERGNYDWNRELAKDYRTSDTDFDTDGARVQLEFSPHPQHVVLVGADTWKLEASPVSFIGREGTDWDPTVRIPLIGDGSLRSTGVFAQDDIYLDDFIVSLGVRYDEVRGSADRFLAGLGPGPDFDPIYREEGLNKTDHNFSWFAGVNWDLDPAFRPYVSLSEGYRSASLLERYLTYPYSDGFNWLSNPQLDPERNRTFEVGARGQIGATTYSIAAYESRIRDYIGGQVRPGMPVKDTINLNRARIRGAEFTLDHDLGEGLNAFAWGTWLQGDNRDSAFDEPLYQTPPPELTVGL